MLRKHCRRQTASAHQTPTTTRKTKTGNPHTLMQLENNWKSIELYQIALGASTFSLSSARNGLFSPRSTNRETIKVRRSGPHLPYQHRMAKHNIEARDVRERHEAPTAPQNGRDTSTRSLWSYLRRRCEHQCPQVH